MSTPMHALPQLIAESMAIYRQAYRIATDGRSLTAVVVLVSGGNDSTILAHIFRDIATHAAHANTGIGIEQTRQYVRDTCAHWGLPVIEKHGELYRDLVLERGFPGPAMHWKMYQRLKERALRDVRRELITNPRRERVIFLAGRRADESQRRMRLADDAPVSRDGSVVWCSPLIKWSALDLNAYRRANPDIPRNEVADLLHMSGECLCGAFAHPGELDEIADWFPEVAAEIRALEEEVAALGTVDPERCRWGWGAYRERPSRRGRLCSSCSIGGAL